MMKPALKSCTLSISVLYIGLLCLSACGEKEVKNPCLEKTPFKAEFDIVQSLFDSLFVVDTVLSYTDVIFKAPAGYTSYKWKIGTDDRTFTAQSFSLFFRDPIGLVNVQLIAKKTPDSRCFPEDDGIDTLKKQFFVRDNKLPLPYEGTFRGYNTDKPTEIFDVTVVNFPRGSGGYEGYHIHNLPNCGTNIISPHNYLPGIDPLYENFLMYGSVLGCPQMYGYGTVKNDSLIVNYYLQYVAQGDFTWKPKKFIGIRQN